MLAGDEKIECQIPVQEEGKGSLLFAVIAVGLGNDNQARKPWCSNHQPPPATSSGWI